MEIPKYIFDMFTFLTFKGAEGGIELLIYFILKIF